MAAARQFLGAPVLHLPDKTAADLRAALGERQPTLASRLDFPETHLQMAGAALTKRNFPAAASAFREVVRMDPQRTDAWVMLVRLAAASEGSAAARAVLDEAMQANPEDADLNALAATLSIERR
jgi:Tfp pilus assembly protein PilF